MEAIAFPELCGIHRWTSWDLFSICNGADGTFEFQSTNCFWYAGDHAAFCHDVEIFVIDVTKFDMQVESQIWMWSFDGCYFWIDGVFERMLFVIKLKGAAKVMKWDVYIVKAIRCCDGDVDMRIAWSVKVKFFERMMKCSEEF